jgi:hypothetical protein
MRKSLFYLLFSVLTLFPVAAIGQIPLNGVPTHGIGQDDLNHGGLNLVEGRELNGPVAVALDATLSPPALYISDFYNNRVLGFRNASAFSNGQKADIVIGQLDFLSTTPQGPGSSSSGGRSTGLAAPAGLVVDTKGNLYVVDTGNNRILRFPAPFSHTTQFPDLVIGQGTFNTNAPNTAGVSAKTLKFYDGTNFFIAFLTFDRLGNLWVADAGNNRVLRYNVSALGTGATNGPAADIVLGQTDFVTATYNNPGNDTTTLTAINTPTGVVFDNEGRLYVSESSNTARGRILVYNGALGIGSPANRLIGVVPSTAAEQPLPISEQQLGVGPGNVFLLNDGVVIADSANHRFLVYPPASQFTSNPLTQQAVAVIGQVNFATGTSNQGLPEPNGQVFFSPQSAVATASEIFVADFGNNRVLVMPYSGSGASTVAGAATRVLGQDQLYLNAPNLLEGREFRFQGAGFAAGMVLDNSSNPPHLYVADPYNNRVLGFNDIRTVNFGAKADLVIGQPDFQRSLINYPTNNPSTPNGHGLYFPSSLALDSQGNLYVADLGNSRVLRFPRPFDNPSPLPAANLVLGQFSMTGPTITDASANTMSQPSGLAWAHDNGLLVADQAHNRVLFFQGTPASLTSGMSASNVWGQPNFTSTAPAASSTNPGNRFNSPHGIATDADDQLYVADTRNNRIVIFGRVYTAGPDPVPGDSLISASVGGVSVNISQPVGVFVNQITGEIWIADTGAGLAVRFPNFNLLPIEFFLPNALINTGTAPLAVVQDTFGDLFIADSGNRITIYYPTFSMLNAANFYPNRALAPGMLATIFGTGDQFTTAPSVAGTVPLPTQIQNVQVTFAGTPAPLFYLGNSQINFQVPEEAPSSGTAQVTIQRVDTGQILGVSSITMSTVSPALFSVNGSAQGQVVALNQDNTVNGPSNPAPNGTVIQLFGTGQGIVPNMPPDGAPATGPTPTPYTPTVVIGTGLTNNPLPQSYIQYSGLAPGLVGVWQVNALIPESVAPTALSPLQATPVAIGWNGVYSNGQSGGYLLTTIWVKAPK